jgi:hypothetical protein
VDNFVESMWTIIFHFPLFADEACSSTGSYSLGKPQAISVRAVAIRGRIGRI